MHVSTTLLASVVVAGLSSAYPIDINSQNGEIRQLMPESIPESTTRTHILPRADDDSLLSKDQKAAMQKENPTKIKGPVVKENPADAYNGQKKEQKLQDGLKKSGMLRRGDRDDQSLLSKEQKQGMQQQNPSRVKGPIIKQNPADQYNGQKKEQQLQAGLKKSGMLRRGDRDDQSLLSKDQKQGMQQQNPSKVKGPIIKQNPADAYNSAKKEQQLNDGLKKSGMLRREADDEQDEIEARDLYQRADDEALLSKDQKAAMQQQNPTKVKGPVIKQNPADPYNGRKKEEQLQAGLKKSGMMRRGDDETLLSKDQKAQMEQQNPTKVKGPVIKQNPADPYNGRKKEQQLQAGLKKSGMLRREEDVEGDDEE